VRFEPRTAGRRNAVLTIPSDKTGRFPPVPLVGTGTLDAVPAADFDPEAVDFGTAPLENSDVTAKVKVASVGTAPLALSSIAVTGSEDFLGHNDCPTGGDRRLQPGHACTVVLHFDPSAAVARRGRLTIITNAADSPHDVPLTGMGATGEVNFPTLALDPGKTVPKTRFRAWGEHYVGRTELYLGVVGGDTLVETTAVGDRGSMEVRPVVPANAKKGRYFVFACDARGHCAKSELEIVVPGRMPWWPLILLLPLVGGTTLVFRRQRPPDGPPDDDTPGPHGGDRGRPVRTGFAPRTRHGVPLDNSEPLVPRGQYWFWVDVGELRPAGDGIDQPGSARLTVALFDYPDELQLTTGAVRAEIDVMTEGPSRVVSQGAIPPRASAEDPLLARRLFFPVVAPAPPGRYHLRCNMYHHQVLVQSRVVHATVARRAPVWSRLLRATRIGRTLPNAGSANAHRADVDYTVSARLDPDHLKEMRPHDLSLMLNHNDDKTHGVRVLGRDGVHASIAFDVAELQAFGDLARVALRMAMEEFPGSERPRKYRYGDQLNLAYLTEDLACMAKRGGPIYMQFMDRFRKNGPDGPQEAQRLHELLRSQRTVQVANLASVNHVLPIALFYDHAVDDRLDAKEFSLCGVIKQALLAQRPLVETECFQGNCPERDVDDVVCPSGFWGFRHVIGMPPSPDPSEEEPAGMLDRPLRISVGVAPIVDVAVSIDPDLVRRQTHEQRLYDLLHGEYPELVWAHRASRKAILELLRESDPHLIYFYCHGTVAGNQPLLKVGSPKDPEISESNLSDPNQKVRWAQSHPLVFINGCHTTALEPHSPFNFVNVFMGRNAAAGVIGTDVSVFEDLACRFAEDFIRRFMVAHEPLGEAMKGTRLALLSSGNPLGLAYVAFASNDLQVAQERVSAPLRAAVG
jgi:hypothetical protein